MDQTTLNLLLEEIRTIKKTLANMVTKEDARSFATKDDLKSFATKDDLKNFATKDDIHALKNNIHDLSEELKKTKEELKEEIRNVEIDVSVSTDKTKAEKSDLEMLEKRIDRLEHKIAV